MDDKRNLPEVLHVGFSKCASTFLQAFFESHPQIYLVNQSHYFSPFQMDFYHKGKGWYSTLYQQAGKDQKKLESDEHIIMPLLHPILQSAATTIDSVKEVTERMIETNPSVKVILIVRNQLSLMVSRYSEFLLCGGKNDFETFVEEQLSCSKDGRNYYENFYFQILGGHGPWHYSKNSVYRRARWASRSDHEFCEQSRSEKPVDFGRYCRCLAGVFVAGS